MATTPSLKGLGVEKNFREERDDENREDA